ncbi:MAG: hypothetical protein JOY66_20255 [Acetobacteraceae bacterium]|nr:hypothetical protein [Acetobacteraceae bacterium]
MRLPPSVVVYGLADARLALAAGLPVTLLSAPGAALFAGVGFWHALVAQAKAEHPDVTAPDILDCGDAAGFALAALRLGQRILILEEGTPGRPAVAAVSGATVLAARPPALDLARPGAARLLPAWLRDAPDDSGPGLR